MSVKIRLSRHGAKKHPYYRIVVADSRKPRDGEFIDLIGRYNPCVDPSMVTFDMDKVEKWLSVGAQPTDTVARLLKDYRADNPVKAEESALTGGESVNADSETDADENDPNAEGEPALNDVEDAD